MLFPGFPPLSSPGLSKAVKHTRCFVPNSHVTHHICSLDASVPPHRTAVAPMAWEPSWPPRGPCQRRGCGTGPCWPSSVRFGWFYGTSSPSSSGHSARHTCLKSIRGESCCEWPRTKSHPVQNTNQLKSLRKRLLGASLESVRTNTPGSSLIFEAIPIPHSFWSSNINFQNRRYFLSSLCVQTEVKNTEIRKQMARSFKPHLELFYNQPVTSFRLVSSSKSAVIKISLVAVSLLRAPWTFLPELHVRFT